MTFKYQQQFVLIYHSHITIFTIREYKKQTFLLYIAFVDDVVYIGLYFFFVGGEREMRKTRSRELKRAHTKANQ